MEARGDGRRGAVAAGPVIGLGTIALTIACGLAWIAGWNALAALAGLAALSVGATVAGTDSRARGDWTTAGRP